jgi:hypothetical protein
LLMRAHAVRFPGQGNLMDKPSASLKLTPFAATSQNSTTPSFSVERSPAHIKLKQTTLANDHSRFQFELRAGNTLQMCYSQVVTFQQLRHLITT